MELSTASTIAALGGAKTMAATTDRGPDEAPAAPREGTERYEDVEALGVGGMGEVRRVRDRDLMRDLAVKRLRPELRGDRRHVRQFLWEARVTAHLDHPNIVPLHDLGITDDGSPYFTMKYVRGSSLRAFIDEIAAAPERCPPPVRRLRMFLQLCHAIEFAHEHGVLHRDLKPDNVMIGAHGELLVMDWGIALPLPGHADAALELPDHEPSSPTPSISGTPMYMSPEQASGLPLDERSDVYTLGVILYELMTLHRPFEGGTVPGILARVIEGEATPLSQVAPDLSPSIVAVIERAMHVDPKQRYARVADLRADVELVLDGGTPTAERASLARRVGRFYLNERNPWLKSMRGIDLELMMTSALLFGLALGAVAAGAVPVAWVLVASVALGGYATFTWLRNHRRLRERGP